MREEEDPNSIRRREWRVEIRRRQLEDYFQKKRYELVSREDTSREGMDDETRCQEIASHISRFDQTELRNILAAIAAVDPSLQVFFHLSRLHPLALPQYFQTILEDTCRNRNSMLCSGLCFDREYSGDERALLALIWRRIEAFWEGAKRSYSTILCGLREVEPQGHLREDFVYFLGRMLASLLIFKRLAGVLEVSLAREMLVGHEIVFDREIESSLYLLYNICAGSEELLAPLLEEVVNLIGCSVECEPLFYNLFLIRTAVTPTRLRLYENYSWIIQNSHEEVLDAHESIVYTLYTAFHSPTDFGGQDRERFLMACERIVKFLGELLRVVNMRYDRCRTSPESDQIFVFRLSWVLCQLAKLDRTLVGLTLEEPAIRTFLLNQLSFSLNQNELRAQSISLKLLAKAAEDSYALHFFLNEEPRLLLKGLNLLNRFLEVELGKAAKEVVEAVSSLMLVLSNLSVVASAVEQLLQQDVLSKVNALYFRVSGQSDIERETSYSCEIVYLNLLAYLKEHSFNLNSFYELGFGNSRDELILVHVLRFTPNRIQAVRKALTLLSYIAFNHENSNQFPKVRAVLFSHQLGALLEGLQQCGVGDLAEKAMYISKIVEKIRRNEAPEYDPDDLQLL